MATFEFIAILLLTAPFWISAIVKSLDFAAATREVATLGLPQPRFFAAGTIAVQALGSLSLILGVQPWFGAGALALFTVLATLLAHAFWRVPSEQRVRVITEFLANIGLIGGLLLAGFLRG